MSNSSPVVSVVIPMYNVAKYIRESLNSVLVQTFRDFEVICVDDGCSDETVAIVKRYSDPRIKIVQQANRGLSGARNTGIAAATGRFVALLDADDRWHSEKLQRHVAHLLQRPHVGVSYSPSLFMDDDSNDLNIGQFPKLTNISKKHVFCRNPIGNGSAPVIRKSVFEQVAYWQDGRKMYFDESLRQSEDIECWTRICLQTNAQFEGIAQPLTYYRVNAGGLSANLDKQLESWKNAMRKLRSQHTRFFAAYYRLALAYQHRYLTRRAIQSGNRSAALKHLARAIKCDGRIFIEEPLRSINTMVCTLLSMLPRGLYKAIEKVGMNLNAALR
ncbi:glycosyltransferase family 2 protein [Alteromonas sp. ASW11-36]|uniref:Glycosyltransferase family 2 protein n=1 Tax=Alteromonas arenosi TaxID=3055817 RepID=A0ABT7SUT6_9ALTE|nr:glycosyltransferase family 2 protein [Alteromonas sp. ASW11-36]MDM7859304.1 glycosyltransferase family 2 protein [Alteromonas sp. ASW11-36]